MNQNRLSYLLLASGTALGALAPNHSAQGGAGQPDIIVSNGPGDDTDNLQAALDQAGSGPAIIRFLTGQQYDFYPPTSYPTPDLGWVHLENANNIEIDGDNAVLVLNDFDPNLAPYSDGSYPTRFFGFENVDGLHLHSLSVQMPREPYSSGVITDKSPTGTQFPWVDIALEQDYPELDSNFQIQAIGDFDPAPASRRLKGHSFNMALQPGWYTTVVTRVTGFPPKVTLTSTYDTATNTDPARAWINYVLENATIGNGAVLMHSKYRCHFLLANGCSDLAVSGVTIRDIPGMGIVAFNTDGITLTNFDIQPLAGRLLSATADAVHLQDCTGAVVLDGCDFRRTGDDGFNSGGKFLKLTKVQKILGGPTHVYFDEVPGQPYWLLAWSAAPQELEFFSPALARRGSSQMTNFGVSPSPTFGQYKATFQSGLPPGAMKGDLVGNPDKLPASITIQDCSVEDNIGRGVVLHNRHAVIDDCVFRRTSGPAVLVESELISFYETTAAIDVAITDCVIEDSNRYMWLHLGAITVLGEYMDAGGQRLIAGAGLHKDILIQGNSFTGLGDESSRVARRVGIWIASSDDVDLLDNTFTDIGVDVASCNPPAPNGRTVGIARVENSTNVVSNGLNCVDASYTENASCLRPAFTLINTLFNPALVSAPCGWSW